MKKFCLLLLLILISGPIAAETFRVSDIRVDGLQRISEGNVFSFIPVEVGDTLTPALARSTIRDLYRTGFFNDISLGRENDVLVITVEERAAISAISIAGNRQIKTEDLMPALAGIGIAEGEIFNQLQLDRVNQELIRQYFSRGYYGVDIDPRVTRLERNRVNLSILVAEGDQARVRHINIVGNETFSNKELRSDFESHTTRGLAFWRGRNQYTREKLAGDLEQLRSFYLDRGFIDFAIESTQVSISPDKQNIYITANIREGEVFKVSDVTLTGNLVLPEDTLRQLIMIEPGDTFSRRDMEQSMENMSAILSNIGYAFANINPYPSINRDTREVEINFFIEPGQRVYVRRIDFRGNTQTKDEVLRREMRQFEGSWFSQIALDRSRLRIQRLGFFENVNIETNPVEGSDDQVDIVVNVEEQASGSFQIGLGYSGFQGIIASIQVDQDNFLGSGRRVGFGVSRSRFLTQASVNYTNPYWTDDGVSRGFFARYSQFDTRDRSGSNIASFSTSQAATGVNIGFPISELDYLRFGGSVQRMDINLPRTTVPIDPDDLDQGFVVIMPADPPLGIALDFDGDTFLSRNERRVTTYRLDGTWSRDSRNHFLNPTRGSLNRFNAEIALPGSTREFYKVSYRFRKYWPIGQRMAFAVRGDVSYGDAYDNYDRQIRENNPHINEIEIPEDFDFACERDEIVTADSGLPFYEHYYAGGVQDVRGFDDNSLGPKGFDCRSIGGAFKVIGGVELAFPIPFVEARGTRLAWFVDVGNVYTDWDSFDSGLLRASTGISLTWQAPIGPIIISLSQPVRKRSNDDIQPLQFTFGGIF